MKDMTQPLIAILVFSMMVSCDGSNDELLLSGVLETDDYDLVAPFSANLTEIRVEEGDNVLEGDTLAVLDTVVVGAKRRSALAEVRRAQANLSNLEAGSDKEKIMAAESRLEISVAKLEQTKRDLKRAEKLHSEALIGDQSLEISQLKLQTAQSAKRILSEELADLKRGARIHELSAARAALSQSEGELSVLKKQLDDAFLIANTSGIVHLLPYQTGELVPAGRSVATIHSLADLWIRIFVPEDKLDRVSLGDSLSFSVDAYPDKHFLALITHISSSAEFTPRNVQTQDERMNLVFAVKLVVLSGAAQLRAGMPADFLL